MFRNVHCSTSKEPRDGTKPKNCSWRNGRLPEGLGPRRHRRPPRSGPARRPAPPRARRRPGAETGSPDRAPVTLPPRPHGRLPSLRRSPQTEHLCPAPPPVTVRIRGRADPPHGGCWRGGAVASSSSRPQVLPPLQTVLGAQEWTRSKTKQESSKRPLGRIVSLLLNRGLNREGGKGGERARSPATRRGSARSQPGRAESPQSPDSCVLARGWPPARNKDGRPSPRAAVLRGPAAIFL